MSISSRSGQRVGVVLLDAVDEQHRLVVGEAVDAGGGLHDEVRDAGQQRADRLADVDDRAGADADHEARSGALADGARERPRIGVHVGALVAQHDVAHAHPRRAQRGGHRRLDLAGGAGHRAPVGDERNVAGAAQLGGHGRDLAEHAGAEQHGAEAERPQPGRLRSAGELVAQRGEVARRVGR